MNPTNAPSSRSRRDDATDWTANPFERARFLDGECAADERAAREADLGRDPVARERVRRESAFLTAVRAAATAPERAEASERIRDVEERVRRALAADRGAGMPGPEPIPLRRRVGLRVGVFAAAAAAVAAGFVVVTSLVGTRPTGAGDERALLAAKTLRMALMGSVPSETEAGATCGQGVASPYRFPPVAQRELSLSSCSAMSADGAPQSVSVLRSEGEDSAPLGLVGVPWTPSRDTAPEVGITTLEDVVVFDVAIGGARYFLATQRSRVEKEGSCAACHGESRKGKANPHSFRERNR